MALVFRALEMKFILILNRRGWRVEVRGERIEVRGERSIVTTQRCAQNFLKNAASSS
jgi:hypothetical protein